MKAVMMWLVFLLILILSVAVVASSPGEPDILDCIEQVVCPGMDESIGQIPFSKPGVRI